MRRTMTRQLKKVLYTLLCGILLLGNKTAAFAATEAVYESDVERGEDKVYRGVVNTDELNVRKAAGKNNPLVQVNGKDVTLNKHDEVAVLDKTLSSKETWYKVSFRRGDSLIVGYVHGSYVDLKTDVVADEITVSTATEAVYEHDVERGEDKVYRGVVNTDGLNVRKAAGKNNPLVQVNGKGVILNKHDEVAVLDKTLSSKETWYKVSFRRGDSLIVGYVHGSYVDLKTDVITPLPSSFQNSLSADSVTDSQAEESGVSIGFWIAVGVGVIVVAILILCISNSSGSYSSSSYSSSYSSSSYSDSYSGSSYSDSYSSSSYDSSGYSGLTERDHDELDALAHSLHEQYGEDWAKDV